MIIYKITIICIFLFVSSNFYFHFGFAFLSFALDSSIKKTSYTINTYNYLPYSQFNNNSNHKSNYINTTQINYLINISSNQGHSELPKIAVLGTNVYVIWLDDTLGNRDIFFKRSIDGGRTFEKTINLSNTTGGAFDHQIAIMDNYVFVVWEQSPNDNGQIFFKRSIDGGRTFEKTINMGNNTGFFGIPQISVSKNIVGNTNRAAINVYVVWHDSSNGIVLRKSNNNGNTFDKTISLSNNYSLTFNPKISSQGNNIYSTWISIHNQSTENQTLEIAFTKSLNKGITFDKVTNITNNAKLSFDPQIASSGNNVYIVWTNGTFVTNEFPLLKDTIFIASSNFGETFDKAISLNNYTGWSVNPKIKSSGDKLYVLWEEVNQNKNGDIILCAIGITHPTECDHKINVSNNTSNSIQPSFDISNSGDVFVTWVDDNANNGSSISIKKINNYKNKDVEKSTILFNTTNAYSSNPQVVVSNNYDKAFILWNSNLTSNDEIYLKNINYTIIGIPREVLDSNKEKGDNRISNYPLTNNIIYKDTDNSLSALSKKDTNRIALVDPTFTNAAYDNSFYIFYNLYNNFSYNQNITKYLNLLTSKINKDITSESIEQISPLTYLVSSSPIVYLKNHISNLIPNANVSLITDVGIDNGSIFYNNTITSNKYNVLILGHQEYVTQKEYNYLKQFVTNGGILILPYSNIFYAEVKYNYKNDTINLVKGHYWAFNGKSAWRSINERWENETAEWVGSNYNQYLTIFGNNPFGYGGNEEQFITNPKVTILLDYNASISTKNITKPHDFRVAAYEYNYKKGKVIALGIYPSAEVLNNERFLQFLDSILLKYVDRY
jgi:hypothetical protein